MGCRSCSQWPVWIYTDETKKHGLIWAEMQGHDRPKEEKPTPQWLPNGSLRRSCQDGTLRDGLARQGEKPFASGPRS